MFLWYGDVVIFSLAANESTGQLFSYCTGNSQRKKNNRKQKQNELSPIMQFTCNFIFANYNNLKQIFTNLFHF